MPGMFPTLSSGVAYKYPVKRGVSQRMGRHTFCDMTEMRYAKGIPLTSFELTYRRLSTADKETLRQFYIQQKGEYSVDWQMLFDGTLYRSCQFIGPFEATNVGRNLWDVTLKIRAIQAGGNASGAWIGGTLALPHGAITAAGLYIVTSHVLGSPASGGAMCSIDGLSVFSHGWMDDFTAWTLRTDSTTVAPGSVYGLNVLFACNGLVRVTNTSPDQFLIYDCWLSVTYADGTFGTMRPTVATIASDSALFDLGSVTNPDNAIDRDPSTYCLITYPSISFLDYSPALRLSNFV